ncbi:MAG TPA: cytochrome c oxidase accessory protein CcoG [Kaistia sp.]|nr:cytochrome c oxidase accessory protein CcoG [Kaistia sp.]
MTQTVIVDDALSRGEPDESPLYAHRIKVERRIEGDRNARIKLDAEPFGGRKARKRVTKHAIWLVIAALTGGAWIMYFNDAPTVVRQIFTGEASATVYGFVALFTGTTYLLAGWAREQVCTYMCPWPRFQAAMFDEDTLVVTYQRHRGEPRGKLRKGPVQDGRPVGDCVACNQCVAVCPTGIDIRDGIQLECIGCALCVDACDAVMDKIGKPRGLIGYDTERNRMNRAARRPTEYRLFRARTAIYATLLTCVGVFMLWGLTTRPSLDVNVLHDRSPLYVTLSNGDIRNGYTVKVLNMSRSAWILSLDVEGAPGAQIAVAGSAGEGQPMLTAEADSVATHQVFVRLPRDALTEEAMPITFLIRDAEGETATHDAVFRGSKP